MSNCTRSDAIHRILPTRPERLRCINMRLRSNASPRLSLSSPAPAGGPLPARSVLRRPVFVPKARPNPVTSRDCEDNPRSCIEESMATRCHAVLAIASSSGRECGHALVDPSRFVCRPIISGLYCQGPAYMCRSPASLARKRAPNPDISSRRVPRVAAIAA